MYIHIYIYIYIHSHYLPKLPHWNGYLPRAAAEVHTQARGRFEATCRRSIIIITPYFEALNVRTTP